MAEIKIHERDNVAVNTSDGHKYALCGLCAGDDVCKYGWPIGRAVRAVKTGERVHTDNMETKLSGTFRYEYGGGYADYPAVPEWVSDPEGVTFSGYLREDGNAGIRNDIWIIPTVGCVNGVAERLSDATGAFAFTHPFGCSQLGDDQKITQLVLRGLVNHPNAGGVLVLGLGCENNNISVFREVLGDVNTSRVKFLNCQDVPDEIAEGIRLISELRGYADGFTRRPLPLSMLRVGLKCGGSDGLSGITANPLVGRVSDAFVSLGASAVLTEVPEMFGAEHLLMRRALNREVFDKTVLLINNFKDYYARHGQVCYENPSPGNKAGGITTLEEKSLGCVQKAGTSPVVGVLDYGEYAEKRGLSLLNGPGNDIVAVTNLAAAGCQIVLFTTGRGTPLGGPVPTLKISSNARLSKGKPGWIDFDASPVLEGRDLTRDLFELVLRTASGAPASNERNGYRGISIFKDGVML